MEISDLRLIITLPTLISLGGCEKIDKWLSERLLPNGRANQFEIRMAEIDKKVGALQSAIESLKAKIEPIDDTFGGCVLGHMSSAITDTAAFAIKEACLHSVSKDIDDSKIFSLSTANYGQIFGYAGTHFGLYINFKNLSKFIVTEVVIAVINNATGAENFYTVSYFNPPEAPGTTLSALTPDRTRGMQLAFGESIFTLELQEKAQSPSDFFKRYSWKIVSAKGFEK